MSVFGVFDVFSVFEIFLKKYQCYVFDVFSVFSIFPQKISDRVWRVYVFKFFPKNIEATCLTCLMCLEFFSQKYSDCV